MPATSSLLHDRYLLTERIGVGGFSEVWRAHDQVLDRPVAVKLLHPGFAAHQETLHRFRAEARHAGSLSHPNIAHIYDYGDPTPAHPAYLVMELVDGESLAALLERVGALDAARTMDITAQTAAGLAAAHQTGLIHRDIKPANLLLDSAGVVKITDFGIAYAAGSAPVTGTGMIIGTPAYFAPERASGAQGTEASDLYALGVVAYECLAGAPPFAGPAIDVAVAHRERPFPPLPASIPYETTRLVGDLTAKHPADRPASAAEVAARAGQVRDRLAGIDREPSPIVPPYAAGPATLSQPARHTQLLSRPVERRRSSWGLAVGVAAGVIAASLIYLAGVSLLRADTVHAGHTTAQRAARHSPTTAARVNVNGAALIGQPVSQAVKQLRGQHLVVRVRWLQGGNQPNGDQPTGYQQGGGQVVAIRPVGWLRVGSTVTITATWGHDHGHHHGHGGGNGGNGGGQGD